MKVNKKEIIEAKILQNQGIIKIADIVAEGISKQYAIKFIYFHDTALYLLGLSKRKPICFTITVPRGYKVNYKGQSPLKKSTAVEEYYSVGMDTAVTPYGHTVPCYNAERALCDIFRTDTEMKEKQFAVKEYLNGKKNLSRLMEYAKLLHVEKKSNNIWRYLIEDIIVISLNDEMAAVLWTKQNIPESALSLEAALDTMKNERI